MARPVRLPKRTKYRAIRTVVDGISFASKKEARRYSELKLRVKAGEISGLRCQVPFDIVVNGIKICRYVADFQYGELGLLGEASGVKIYRTVVEDCKGFRTDIYRLKAKLMKALYGIEILET